ncbi:MAG TPA: RNA-protein complex protein Nop10 [Candidatus Deferrimicrobium sp.]|nr:RNA-protein complex protein Nop10 [Candidatus Deferrimicrobium sp.]
MGKLLRKCAGCGQYTILQEICPKCGGKTVNPNPARFSLVDKYGKYRRALKKMEDKNKTDS